MIETVLSNKQCLALLIAIMVAGAQPQVCSQSTISAHRAHAWHHCARVPGESAHRWLDQGMWDCRAVSATATIPECENANLAESAGGCPAGHIATCPSDDWSVDGAAEEVDEHGLSGCVWYCKCNTGCFACDDGNGNNASDILVGLSLNSSGGAVEITRQRVSGFITTRYEAAVERSCASSSEERRLTQLGETKDDVRDESLLSEDEGDQVQAGWGFSPPPAPFDTDLATTCCTALANQSQCSAECDTFFHDEASYHRDANQNVFQHTIKGSMGFGHGAADNPERPCSEWMTELEQAQQEADAILDGWCAAAYTESQHTNALTDARQVAIGSAIGAHTDLPEGYSVSVVAKQHGSSCHYAQVVLTVTELDTVWELRYDVLLTHASDSTDLSAHPLLISKVAARKDGPINVRKGMMACRAEFQPSVPPAPTPSHPFSSGTFASARAMVGFGSSSAGSLEDQWNTKLKAMEPIVRGAINDARFDILDELST